MREIDDASSWSTIIRKIEKIAVKEHVVFIEAVRIFVATPDNEPWFKDVMGHRYQGEAPKPQTFMKHRDQYKLRLAQQWPNLTVEQLKIAAPYLSPERRTALRDKDAKARELLEYGVPIAAVVVSLGISVSKLYQLKPAKKDWKKEACELKSLGVSNSNIAEILDVSISSVSHLKCSAIN